MKYEMNGQLKETSLNTTDLMNCSSVHGWVRTMERADKSDRQALRMICLLYTSDVYKRQASKGWGSTRCMRWRAARTSCPWR